MRSSPGSGSQATLGDDDPDERERRASDVTGQSLRDRSVIPDRCAPAWSGPTPEPRPSRYRIGPWTEALRGTKRHVSIVVVLTPEWPRAIRRFGSRGAGYRFLTQHSESDRAQPGLAKAERQFFGSATLFIAQWLSDATRLRTGTL